MISDLMRYLVYHRNHDESEHARRLFARIPGSVRRRLEETDYAACEALCPQRIAIGDMVKDACKSLA